MAIIISEEKKQFNWLPFLILGIILLVAIIGSYLLFFTNAPLIEYIVPTSQKRISDISAINSEQFISTLSTTKKDLQGRVKQQGSTFLSSIKPGSISTNPVKSNPFLGF